MKISFCNNGVLSMLDLTSMGDSSKRDNSDTIGCYDSGAKYAMCILYRNKVKVSIKSGLYKYTLDSLEINDPVSSKTKEVLLIDQYDLQGNHLQQIVTAFSVKLGHNWQLWQSVRELYSNMKDEKGYFCVNDNESEEDLHKTNDTVITIEHELLDDIYEHWDDYFLDKLPINTNIEDEVLIYNNESEDGLLRIYKQGILIHTDENTKSKFIYNCKSAEIDERRVLSNYYDVRYNIGSFVSYTNDLKIIDSFIDITNEDSRDMFEADLNYCYFSKTWIDRINELQPENLIKSLHHELIKLDTIQLQSKVVRMGHSYYSPQVTIEKIDLPPATALETLTAECKAIGFEIKFDIQESKIKGYKAVGNNFSKVLYIDTTFTIEDMPQFIKAHYLLDSQDENLIFRDYYQLLKQL